MATEMMSIAVDLDKLVEQFTHWQDVILLSQSDGVHFFTITLSNCQSTDEVAEENGRLLTEISGLKKSNALLKQEMTVSVTGLDVCTYLTLSHFSNYV